MADEYHLETFAYFPARLYLLAKETGISPYMIYEELENIRKNPKNGTILTPIYSDIRIWVLEIDGNTKHVLYAIDPKTKTVILIEASNYDLRKEKQVLLYSLSALFEFRRAGKWLVRIITGSLVG